MAIVFSKQPELVDLILAQQCVLYYWTRISGYFFLGYCLSIFLITEFYQGRKYKVQREGKFSDYTDMIFQHSI